MAGNGALCLVGRTAVHKNVVNVAMSFEHVDDLECLGITAKKSALKKGAGELLFRRPVLRA